MTLTTAQLDRAVGVLLGTAAGDALGALTSSARPAARNLRSRWWGAAASAGSPVSGPTTPRWPSLSPRSPPPGRTCATKRRSTPSCGGGTSGRNTPKMLGCRRGRCSARAGRHGISAQTARAESAALHERTGRTAGNGSLMRTAPLALAYLDDEAALVEAARAVSELTHYDPEAGDACVLWCLAIRHAVLTGELDVRIGLRTSTPTVARSGHRCSTPRRTSRPADFRNNGWVVEALQGAWSAITTTPIPTDDPATGVFRADHLRLALDAAVRGGYDTDTVAAIAGGLLGAVYGASAVPAQWRRVLHGWPGLANPRAGGAGHPNREGGQAVQL